MTIQINVKNQSSKPITLTSANPPATIAAGKEAPIDLDVIRGNEVAQRLASGELAITTTGIDKMPADVRAAVIQAVGDVVLRVAPRFVGHYASMTTAIANLAALRDRYNEQYAATVSTITAAKDLAGGAKNLLAASQLDDGGDAAIKAAKQAVADHLAKVPKTEAELKAWFEDHKKLEAAARDAEATTAANRSAIARQLDATRKDLALAAAAFDKADPAKDVGPKLDWRP